jgi:type IV secretion system protein TrbL
MAQDIGMMTGILRTMSETIAGGYGHIYSDISNLFQILVAIEIVLFGIWWIADREMAIKKGLSKILIIGFFIWLINDYPMIVESLIEGFVYMGLKASGDNITIQHFFDPSLIASYGIEVTAPILDEVSVWQPLQAIVAGISSLIILLCYFIIAIQITVAVLEFYISAVLALVLIPFGVLKKTSFLGEKAIGAVISQGVKLMVLAFVMGIISPILSSMPIPKDGMGLNEIFSLVFMCLFFVMIVWQAPAIAAGLMSGAPTLNAGTAVASAGAGGAAIGAAAMTASSGAGGAMKAATSASGIAGTTVGAASSAYRQGSANTSGGKSSQMLGGIKSVASAGASALKSSGANVVGSLPKAFSDGAAKGSAKVLGTSGDSGTKASSSGSSSTGSTHPMKARVLARRAVPPLATPQGGLSAPLNND